MDRLSSTVNVSVRTVAAVAALAVIFLLPGQADAQLDLGIHGVYNTEVEDGTPGIGARAAVGVPATGFGVHGDFNWLFPDCPRNDCELWEILGSARFGLLPASPASPYVGAGFAMQHRSLGPVDTDEAGLNVLAGIELGGVMPLQAFGEVSYRFMDEFDDQLVVAVGLVF